jgi:hypothetical protein
MAKRWHVLNRRRQQRAYRAMLRRPPWLRLTPLPGWHARQPTFLERTLPARGAVVIQGVRIAR